MSESLRYDPEYQKRAEAEAEKMRAFFRRSETRSETKTDAQIYRILFDILACTDAGQNVRKFADHPHGLERAKQILREAGL
jgi:hypothetical protein